MSTIIESTELDDRPENGPGDRVVVLVGLYAGDIATIDHACPAFTGAYGELVWDITFEDGTYGHAFDTALVRSPYQGEPLEDVPNV